MHAFEKFKRVKRSLDTIRTNNTCASDVRLCTRALLVTIRDRQAYTLTHQSFGLWFLVLEPTVAFVAVLKSECS